MAWRTDGFTLIELMIVVAIIGTLSSIAIPTFKGYKARALESEWYANLKAIYVGASAYFQTPHAGTATDDGDLGNCLPHSRRSGNHGGNGAIYALNVMAPPVVIAVALGESLPMTFDWTSDAMWPALNFSMDAPSYMGYFFKPNDPTGPIGASAATGCNLPQDYNGMIAQVGSYSDVDQDKVFGWTSLLIGVRNGQLYKRELIEAPNH